jgi:hypothetical protein
LAWEPGRVTLYMGGVVRATAATAVPNLAAFYHALDFLRAFPFVSDWYFYQDAEYRVRVAAPSGKADLTIFGNLYCDSAEPLLWALTDDATVEVDVPHLPRQSRPSLVPVNLPVQMRVAQTVLRVAQGGAAGAWVNVSTRVPAAELAALLPAQRPTLALPTRLTALIDPTDVLGHTPTQRPWAFDGWPTATPRDMLLWALGLSEASAELVA